MEHSFFGRGVLFDCDYTMDGSLIQLARFRFPALIIRSCLWGIGEFGIGALKQAPAHRLLDRLHT
jgi:hypothetical protein